MEQETQSINSDILYEGVIASLNSSFVSNCMFLACVQVTEAYMNDWTVFALKIHISPDFSRMRRVTT